MKKIIVLSMTTLDGVMQAVGAPKEDTSGGFNMALGFRLIFMKFMSVAGLTFTMKKKEILNLLRLENFSPNSCICALI